jgi:hypothetical protein
MHKIKERDTKLAQTLRFLSNTADVAKPDLRTENPHRMWIERYNYRGAPVRYSTQLPKQQLMPSMNAIKVSNRDRATPKPL